MFRKLVLALGATTVIAAAALAPNTASAKGWHHWHHGYHHWFGVGFYPGYYGSDDCYIVRRVVWTPYGKRVRRVEVCD
jgi:hypothetical protein